MDFVAPSPTVASALERGFAYLAPRQSADGSWHGDYDGPLFLTPGYVFAHYATHTPIEPAVARDLVAYLERAQNRDGGFGMHLGGDTILFTTVLNYVALRLLGVDADANVTQRARRFIHREGGAQGVPSWGKYWLSILNLYAWEGVHPVPPELWLLPTWVPVHPSKLWCHARVVYLAVCWLYGKRFAVPVDATIVALRRELYPLGYDQVDFTKMRSEVCPRDRYLEPSALLTQLNKALALVEKWVPKPIRARALDEVLDHIKHEQTTTTFVDLGPVNKTFDCIVTWAAQPNSEHAKRALRELELYLFPCERGLTMQSYNSSQLWDTGFIALALAESQRMHAHPDMVRRAYTFIDANQVRDDVDQRERYYRDPSKGGWPFSTATHGWPIADCTALGILATLALETSGLVAEPIDRQRLRDAADLLLFWQNDDGGWGTYEKRRGSPLLEAINPSEIFAEIMVDYTQTELTSSAIQGLTAVRQALVDLDGQRTAAIDRAVQRGAQFLRSKQRDDGSWEGNWGICFTYGTWFGICGLRQAGVAANDPAIAKAAAFLCLHQEADGGWGESHLSCVKRRYVAHPQGSQAVMTAWSLLALMEADISHHRPAIARGLRCLLDQQQDDGDWPQGGMTGVFNKTCMLNYRYYRNAFPLWAIAKAQSLGLG